MSAGDVPSPTDPRWRFPVLPSRIRRNIRRPERQLVERFKEIDVTDISNRVGRMYTMRGIHPLYSPICALLGPAFTIKCPPGDNLGVMAGMKLLQPGDVVVIDAQGFTEWCLGGFEILRMAVRDHGAAGFVVNGAYRDVEECRTEGLAVYAMGAAPWSGPKIGPAEINVPVCCGGVIVEPGDLVSASSEGIVVVPSDYLSLVADALDKGESAAPESKSLGSLYDEYQAEMFIRGLAVYLD